MELFFKLKGHVSMIHEFLIILEAFPPAKVE